jgi:hypothetical protein
VASPRRIEHPRGEGRGQEGGTLARAQSRAA